MQRVSLPEREVQYCVSETENLTIRPRLDPEEYKNLSLE